LSQRYTCIQLNGDEDTRSCLQEASGAKKYRKSAAICNKQLQAGLEETRKSNELGSKASECS